MIDGSDLLVNFTDGREKGGTFSSMNYAEKQNIPIQTYLFGAENPF